jgi:hypothetical protein
MDPLSMLLIWATAGQAGWTPDRSESPPPASAREYDRYAQPANSGVAPPPGVVDRTRAAIAESGGALRDGIEAGIDAANQQLQQWSDSAGRHRQGAGGDLRAAAEQSFGSSRTTAPQASNPFVTAPPAATSRPRSGVAPPPWNGSSAATAPDWDPEPQPAPEIGHNVPFGPESSRAESGWSSVSSDVPPPPLLVPPLTSETRTTPARDMTPAADSLLSAPTLRRDAVSGGSADSNRGAANANGADSWATGWGEGAGPATISRPPGPSARDSTSGDNSRPAQTASPRPQDSRQSTNDPWADLWGGQDPWGEPQQRSSPNNAAGRAAANPAAPPNSGNPTAQPLLAPPANNISTRPAAPSLSQPALGAGQTGNAVPLVTGQEPPWLPLLLVSLSLAGSLGANLFLGWSYIDARQRYHSLVRKTADKFRRGNSGSVAAA